MSNNVDPASLSNLHDIVEPVSVSFWWPLAPGWWIVIGLFTILGVWLLIKRFKNWRTNQYRRQSLLELDSIQDPKWIPLLLKRTALAVYPRAMVAGLHGSEWVSFLNTSAPEKVFGKDVGENLSSLSYSNQALSDLERKEIVHASQRWIKTHYNWNHLNQILDS